jgi:hypothetical protein
MVDEHRWQLRGALDMQQDRHEYKGHVIEVRPRQGATERALRAEGEAGPESEAQLELLIDEEPVSYGQLPDGSYFLHEYAYDWQGDLTQLAHRFIDYKDKTEKGAGG